MTDSNTKLSAIFQERLTSLLSDGYKVSFKVEQKELWFVRLKHMCNGNEIKLKAYPNEGDIYQYTNNILVHKESCR